MGSSDIDNWINDAKESMSVFWKEHVEMPVSLYAVLCILVDIFFKFNYYSTYGHSSHLDFEVGLLF